ncbi:MAG: Gfo/Idh/MocA family oxidoreductase [Alphaproteobacteria bacterium]|nr:Gfo/Idh/MocA family oxidoreductase [Alphaproteobacteria bacterium]
MKTFALIGAAGYIAPRHMRAIKDIGGDIKLALDPNDSVGVIDRYFPNARFFVEFERFDRQIDKMRRAGEAIDFISICSPNYLHDAHVRFALRSDSDAICEKPLVLNPWNLDGLAELAERTGRKVNTILQLRLHPAIRALREQVAQGQNRKYDVDLTYITSRGPWYHVSWKGDDGKAGGIATNIGVHFFDMLVDVFGPAETNLLHLRTASRAAGYLELQRARVRWFLSIDAADLPQAAGKDQTTWRSITVDGAEIEFSGGFTDLHTESYRKILDGRGYGIDAVRPSIEIVSAQRKQPVNFNRGERHPMARADMT